MELRIVFPILVAAIAFQCVVDGFPRDISILQKDEISKSEVECAFEQKENVAANEQQNVIKIPGRVSCQYEEASEDIVCQEHCLPKGYSYGLCVGKQCSCI